MTDGELREFLGEKKVVTCATIGPKGRPHLMPLWYAADTVADSVGGGTGGTTLRGWTYAKSQKAKNLERDQHATLQVEDGELYHELRGVMMECDVEIERDADKVANFGRALTASSLVFASRAAVKANLGKKLGIAKELVAVSNTRKISKKSMIHNSATPVIEVDPETYEVHADGELLTCEPASVLPMAQRYFLF